jgi:2-polyprenyl-6-methoxyphenol hydroxylase-like FAD-dependent oxidoreductase
MKVAIIGAGAAGLCLAIGLRKLGHAVTVFDKRPRADLVTAGLFLTLAPNGTRALAALGVTVPGINTTGIALMDERGHALGFYDQSDFATLYDGPSLTLARGDLIAALLIAAENAGADLHFGTHLTGLDPATAHFDTGQSQPFDLLAGCDGLGSTVRKLALPDAPNPHYTGLIGTGGILDVPDLPPTEGTMNMVFGHQAFFGWIKQEAGPVHWFNTYPAATLPSTAPNLPQMHSADPAAVRTILAHIPPSVPMYPIFDMPPLRQWHTGRIVLLGDAAHAVGPHAGQGASLAIMDAMTLTAQIHTDPATAFARYQAICEPFVTQVVRLTARNAASKRQTTAFSRALRRLILPLVLPMGERASRALLAAAPRPLVFSPAKDTDRT